MKKNIWSILVTLSAILIILTGCNSNSSENKSSASSKAELVKSSSSEKKHSEKKKKSSSEKESSSSSLSSEVSSSSSTQSSEDSEGYVTTPEAMRGTWYSYFDGNMDKLVVSEYEMTFTYNLGKEESTRHIILYKNLTNKSLDNNTSETEKESKKDWYSGWYEDYNGIKFLRTRGMFEQGPGEHFAAHTEVIDGQQVPIVITGQGPNGMAGFIYYPNEELAKQQEKVKYDDLDHAF